MRGTPLLSRPPWSYAPSKHAYPAALRVAAPRAPARAPARPHTTASAPATARLDAVRAARNHTDTHPESSRAPARLGAVRAALHHPSLENAASLDAAVDALAHELVRKRIDRGIQGRRIFKRRVMKGCAYGAEPGGRTRAFRVGVGVVARCAHGVEPCGRRRGCGCMGARRGARRRTRRGDAQRSWVGVFARRIGPRRT